MSLSFRMTSRFVGSEPAWFRASNAIPAVIAPSPITATTRRSSPSRSAPTAIPSAALIEVLECPTPKVSYSLSERAGNGASPPGCLMVWSWSRRPVSTLCGYAWCPTSHTIRSRGRVEDVVQGDRQFDGSQSGSEVTPTGTDALDQEFPQLLRQGGKFCRRQLTQVGGALDGIQQRVLAILASHLGSVHRGVTWLETPTRGAKATAVTVIQVTRLTTK